MGVVVFLSHSVRTIHAYWADLSGRLDDDALEELLEILEDMESDPAGAARDLRELVKPFAPPGHPAREALTRRGVRYQSTAVAPPAPQDAEQLLDSLRALRTMVLAGVGGPGASDTPEPPPQLLTSDPPYRPDADDAWLLAEPALPPEVVRRSADDEYVIVLSDENDTRRVPAFQFDPESGAPYPVVIEINRLLSADVDPWGAADWWLGPNLWLRTAPARLLGTGADDALLSAAEAVLPDW